MSHRPLLRRPIQLTPQFDTNPMEHMTAPQIYQSQTFEHETLTKKWIEIQGNKMLNAKYAAEFYTVAKIFTIFFDICLHHDQHEMLHIDQRLDHLNMGNLTQVFS